MDDKTNLVKNISVELIDDPRLAIRTRASDRSFDALVASIRALGMLQPVLVKPNNGRYEIIAGHRRVLAARAAGLLTLPAIVYAVGGADAEVMKLHENICREDVNVVDEAIFLEGVMTKCGLTIPQLAEKIGRSESYIRDRLEMKNWDKEILEAVWRDDISFSAAGWLNKISDEGVRRDWLAIAVRGGITAAQAQHWYHQWSSGKLPEKPTEEIVEDLKSGQFVSVKKVKCSLCGVEMPLIEAILLYGHKECSDYWKIQQRISVDKSGGGDPNGGGEAPHTERQNNITQKEGQ